VLPAIAAVQAFEGRPLALIAGGFERGVDYEPLGAFLAERGAPTIVFTVPQNGERIREAVMAYGCDAVACADIPEAVLKASVWAPPGGVVLLSPAAASYGLFTNYEQRAAAFREAVQSLAATGSAPGP